MCVVGHASSGADVEVWTNRATVLIFDHSNSVFLAQLSHISAKLEVGTLEAWELGEASKKVDVSPRGTQVVTQREVEERNRKPIPQNTRKVLFGAFDVSRPFFTRKW